MARWVVLACLLGTLDQTVERKPVSAPGPTPAAPRVRVADSRARRAVHQAVLGAQKRLANPDCQLLLTDFKDAEGRLLLEQLQPTTQTAPEYLAERIWFVEDDDATQCRRDDVLTAFTAPDYKVVHICSKRFAERFERQRVATEMLIIHEMLHTLGLGENPPSSAAITAQVTKRCARPAPPPGDEEPSSPRIRAR